MHPLLPFFQKLYKNPEQFSFLKDDRQINIFEERQQFVESVENYLRDYFNVSSSLPINIDNVLNEVDIFMSEHTLDDNFYFDKNELHWLITDLKKENYPNQLVPNTFDEDVLVISSTRTEEITVIPEDKIFPYSNQLAHNIKKQNLPDALTSIKPFLANYQIFDDTKQKAPKLLHSEIRIQTPQHTNIPLSTKKHWAANNKNVHRYNITIQGESNNSIVDRALKKRYPDIEQTLTTTNHLEQTFKNMKTSLIEAKKTNPNKARTLFVNFSGHTYPAENEAGTFFLDEMDRPKLPEGRQQETLEETTRFWLQKFMDANLLDSAIILFDSCGSGLVHMSKEK